MPEQENEEQAIRPEIRQSLKDLQERKAYLLDENREEAVAKRHKKGQRTARENIADLYDEGSFLEYGCLLYTSPSPRDATLSRMPSSA